MREDRQKRIIKIQVESRTSISVGGGEIMQMT